MKKLLNSSVLALGLAMVLQSCSTQNQNSNSNETDSLVIADSHTSEISVDWMGTYKGHLACEDCDSTAYSITLNEDGTYALKKIYRGKTHDVVAENGQFTWFDNGSKIKFSNSTEVFQVGENFLFTLNEDSVGFNREQSLKKVNGQLTDIHWKLIQINGKDIQDLELNREPFILLSSSDQRVSANGGCNNIFGSYALDEVNNRLSFGQLASTKMACPNMDIEQQLSDVLDRMDSYHLGQDTLQLFKARMAPLAVLVANYDSL